jgi:hypothetical protein
MINPLVYAVAWPEVRHTETLVRGGEGYVDERNSNIWNLLWEFMLE